jgi:hypothetical protein
MRVFIAFQIFLGVLILRLLAAGWARPTPTIKTRQKGQPIHIPPDTSGAPATDSASTGDLGSSGFFVTVRAIDQPDVASTESRNTDAPGNHRGSFAEHKLPPKR